MTYIENLQTNIGLTLAQYEDMTNTNQDYVKSRISEMANCYVRIHAPWYEGTPEYSEVVSEVILALANDYHEWEHSRETEEIPWYDFYEEINNSQAVYIMNAFVDQLNTRFGFNLDGFEPDEEDYEKVLAMGKEVDEAMNLLTRRDR